MKTQAIAVYRKFGVTSRSAAIERAVDLGLIDEGAAVPTPDSGARTERATRPQTITLHLGVPSKAVTGTSARSPTSSSNRTSGC